MNVAIVHPPAARVELISWPLSPCETLVKVCSVFQGENVLPTDSAGAMRIAVNEVLLQLQDTALQGPLEMLNFTFLITRVTRAFTHQLVRYRIGTSFAQESLRFTKKLDCEVLATTDHPSYAEAIGNTMANYEQMLEQGVPVQDARGVLPTNILTKIYMTASFRTLQNMYQQRMCTQAQHGEWETVLQQVKGCIADVDPRLAELLKMSCEREDGKCIFKSTWDRPCPFRDRLPK